MRSTRSLNSSYTVEIREMKLTSGFQFEDESRDKIIYTLTDAQDTTFIFRLQNTFRLHLLHTLLRCH